MKIVHANPWFRVVQDGDHYYVDEPLSRNGAAVFLRNEGGAFVLVEVFRFPLRKNMIEVPRGYAQENETAIDCAMREVLEETGYRISREQLVKIGSLHPNSGILSSAVGIFLGMAREDQKISEPDREVNRTVVMTEDQIESGIAAGEITDAFTLAAFAFYKSCKKG
jgi:ADP-ribose pyrophosphatase